MENGLTPTHSSIDSWSLSLFVHSADLEVQDRLIDCYGSLYTLTTKLFQCTVVPNQEDELSQPLIAWW